MKNLSRRSFLITTTAGLTVISAKTAFGASANGTVNLGIIGCGKRGIHFGLSFMEDTKTKVTAIADLLRTAWPREKHGSMKRWLCTVIRN